MSTDHPSPTSPDPADPIRPSVIVLPAVSFAPPHDELGPWLERLPIAGAYEVSGTDEPLYVTDPDGGVAVTTTGMGKVPAAATVTALCATPSVDVTDAYWLSAGIAGAQPQRAAIGSVFVADAILDWDRKHRWDPDEVNDASDENEEKSDDQIRTVEQLAYLPDRSLHEADPDLVATAHDAATAVALATDETVRSYQDRYPTTPDHGPRVGVGPTVTSDEFWHGTGLAREVDHLCASYGIDPYVTTQMEDIATATALARFDVADRHVSLRAVANYDRPAPGESVHDSFEGIDASVALAAENAARAGSMVVERLHETGAIDR